jgi:hypothetical protein
VLRALEAFMGLFEPDVLVRGTKVKYGSERRHRTLHLGEKGFGRAGEERKRAGYTGGDEGS